MDDLVIGGHLVVDTDAELHIVDGDGVDLILTEEGKLDVNGMLAGHNGIALDGLTALNCRFSAGSAYRHLATKEGSIPIAQWDPASTFEIRDLSAGAYMASPDWRQTFGNMVYDCPAQGTFVEFNGLLGRIAGDFTILNTNSNILKLLGSQDSLVVDGDIIIEGVSEVWFSESGNCSVSVGGDFHFRSTSTASSYFTTRGLANVTIGGDFVLDAAHRLKMASSTASGHTNLVLLGDVYLLNGELDALGTGSGTITFDGLQPRHVFAAPGTVAFDGNISYHVNSGADVDLHQALITNTTGGAFFLDGTVRLGSASATGMIQAGNSGNIQVTDSVVFGPGSRVIFNGDQTQHIRYPNLTTDVVFANSAGVMAYGDIQLGSLSITEGRLIAGSDTIRVRGDLFAAGPGMIEHAGTLILNGGGEQRLDIRGDTLHNIVIDQVDVGVARLASPLSLSGALTIPSPGSTLVSDGNLILLSTSEAADATASIGALLPGSAVVGAVTVHRFIHGAPGDHYRYISAPVANATVAALMDDVPVTGTFVDADAGPGLPQDAASLFYYDEQGSMWEPYPVAGSASDHPFMPGRGYCFFNWNETGDTDWDVTGPINQGPLIFDLTYTPTADPQLSGWNLVGNPYPATIRWGDVGWVAENVSASIAVRDDVSGGFRYWDGQTGSLPSGRIASGQAFWVRTVAANPSLRVDENAKANEGGRYFRRRPPDFLELTMKVGHWHDKAYLRLRKGSDVNLDAFDAPKLRNDSLSLAFRTADNVDVAINAIPDLLCLSEIPLAIAHAGDEHDLEFVIQAEGIVRGSSFAIMDTLTGRRYNFDHSGSLVITDAVNLSALRLLIVSGIPEPVEVSAPKIVCPDDTLVITAPRRHAGVQYFLSHEGRSYLPLADSGGTLYFDADALPRGQNAYVIMGHSACAAPVPIDSMVVGIPDNCVTGGFTMPPVKEENERVVAFPIPCRDLLHIAYPGTIHALRLYTAGGMLIRNMEVPGGDGRGVLDLSGVEAGNYFLYVWDKDKYVTIRIVKVD